MNHDQHAPPINQAPAMEITNPTPPLPSGRPVPAVVQAWATAWNTSDARGMAELFTTDGVYQDFAFQARIQGKEGVATWVTMTVTNVPGANITILDAFQTGNRAVVQWTFTGTPLRFATLEATGKSFTVPAVSVFELEGERIKQVSDYYNLADLFRQVGLSTNDWPPTPPA